jgi:hypothetical protein
MIKKIVITFLLALCIPAIADAEGLEGPCKKDRESLCKDAPHVMKCMRDNKDKVSAECKAHMEAKKESWKAKHKDKSEMRAAMREACKKDPKCEAKLKEHKEKKAN